jgi:hypothetical protein
MKSEYPTENHNLTAIHGNHRNIYIFPGIPGKLLLAFSVYTNGAKILSAEQGKDVLTCKSIYAIPLRSTLSVNEIRVSNRKSCTYLDSHKVVSSTPRHE